jgi:Domain of unknown function (DUF5056)
MTDISDQALEELLRRDFKAASDDGFSARVMRALPQQASRRQWLMPAAAIAGFLLAWLTLLPSPLLQQAARDWLAGNMGPSTIVLWALVLCIGLLGCGWALEEAS